MPKIIGRRPTVAEYYQEHVNCNVNLLDSPKQCCPFHSEKTPSFSYNIETGRWSCFGKCHAHGDVVEFHRRWYHLDSKEEAERSLDSMYEVPRIKSLEMMDGITYVSEESVENNTLYNEALMLANTPTRWVELDYVMSLHPFDSNRLLLMLNEWKGVKNPLDFENGMYQMQ